MNTYKATRTPNELGRMVWIVTNHTGAPLCHSAQYRGDAGRVRIFRSEAAAVSAAAVAAITYNTTTTTHGA